MKLWITFVGISLLAGCSSLPLDKFNFASNNKDAPQGAEQEPENWPTHASGVVDIGTEVLAKASVDNHLPASSSDPIDAFGAIKTSTISVSEQAFRAQPLAQHVGDYVRNMAHELVSNMEFVSERTPVAVTHFSLIDSDLQQTNLLGHQMAASFVHEFHKFRMPVVEYKVTQFIRVTDKGDFALSRDFLDLSNTTPIEYVLTGTMTKHQGGFIVNANMLSMGSNVVVASAQSFIPFYIVDAILPSVSSRGVKVVDGVTINAEENAVSIIRGD